MIIAHAPYQLHIQSTFWTSLYEKKLKEWKLDEPIIDIHGKIIPSVSKSGVKDGSSEIYQIPSFSLDGESFNGFEKSTQVEDKILSSPMYHQLRIPGVVKTFNTLNELRSANKQEYFTSLGKKILGQIYSWFDQDIKIDLSKVLNSFILLSFADLKRYQFYYYIGFPVWNYQTPFSVTISPNDGLLEQSLKLSEESSDQMINKLNQQYFMISEADQKSHQRTVSNLSLSNKLKKKREISNDIYFCFCDHLKGSKIVGNKLILDWTLRNFIIFLFNHFPGQKVNIISVRDFIHDIHHQTIQLKDFTLFTLNFPNEPPTPDHLLLTGWNADGTGKVIEHQVNIASLVDDSILAKSSLYLNLELMKWRMVPELNLDIFKSLRCLCIGSGTLGCNVSRGLLSWGITNITLIDNGKISFSNPVKQSLFQFDHAKEYNGEKNSKSKIAAQSLKSIYPLMNAVGIDMTIPMPGHFIESEIESLESIDQLDTIIQAHDVVFLLTDSRESRWLPTLLGSFYQKTVITIALGFDNFLVIRHGKIPHSSNQFLIDNNDSMTDLCQQDPPPSQTKLSCYFCHDVVGPTDSVTQRTLDQQCTIARPGLSMIASGYGVELMASVIQEEYAGILESNSRANSKEKKTTNESYFYSTPQQIRGSVYNFQNTVCNTECFHHCLACSSYILKKYSDEGKKFILNAIKTPSILEQITAIDLLTQRVEDLECIDTESSFSISSNESDLSFHSLQSN